MVSSLIFAAAVLTANIDCDKVKWFVETYGTSEARHIARKLGYTEAQIKSAERQCLKH